MMEFAFGAGSVPCEQQHTMSMEIELARPTTQAGTCPLLGVLVALLALAIFCRCEKQLRITERGSAATENFNHE